MFCYCVFLVQAEYPYFSANLKDWQHSKIHKNENIQMCNKIPVATTFISPASDFTPSHDWNVLSSRKISSWLLNRSFLYCFTSEIVLLWPEFYVLPPRPAAPLVAAILFLPEQSWTHFQVLCFGSHMRSSWDLPFNKCPPNDLSRLARFNSNCT